MSEQPVKDNAEPTPAGPKPFRSEFAMEFDNLDEELSKIPLFMTDLPTEENDTLAALQSLAFDGTPEGIVSLLYFHIFDGTLLSNIQLCQRLHRILENKATIVFAQVKRNTQTLSRITLRRSKPSAVTKVSLKPAWPIVPHVI